MDNWYGPVSEKYETVSRNDEAGVELENGRGWNRGRAGGGGGGLISLFWCQNGKQWRGWSRGRGGARATGLTWNGGIWGQILCA